MFIFKNALLSISRSKGRNLLIGIIVLVIAFSACIGLSIRQASESAKTDTLDSMTVTATISFDRQSMMGNMGRPSDGGGDKGGFDRDQFKEQMGAVSSPTLADYQTYADADSVKDFYYTLTAYLNGSDSFEAVSSETDTTDNAPSMPSFGGGGRGDKGSMFRSGDFTVIGYSNDTAMTAFANGTTAITDGTVFEEGTADYDCILSEELALYNSLAVGDTVTLTNTALESETYTLTVVGIYQNSEANDLTVPMFGVGQDPANQIYMSATALQSMVDASVAAQEADENTALTATLSPTYVFADTDAYYQFETDVRTLGLADTYTVSSSDITAFENSLVPLNTLSTMAGWFLIVILVIGAVILIVLNVFNVRERKYEIGVLTAMGMKKRKVALQFLAETLIVTMVAVFAGIGIGTVSSVPVTNALLQNQIESQQAEQTQMENNFGRPNNMGGRPDDMMQKPDGGDMGGGKMPAFMQSAQNYLTEVNAAVNLTVVLQMMGLGVLLSLVSSAVSVLFVMRYDPLKILANRD